MRWKTLFLASIISAFSLALVNCAPSPMFPNDTPLPAAPGSVQSTPTSPRSTESIMPESTLSPELQTVAKQATAILVETLGVTPDDVTILEIERVTWRDGSLGCPKPGMMYTQVITPGYLVKAEVKGEFRMVHMDEKGHGVVCSSDSAKPSGAISPGLGK